MTRKAAGNRARTKAEGKKTAESRRASSTPRSSAKAPPRAHRAGGSLDLMSLYFGE